VTPTVDAFSDVSIGTSDVRYLAEQAAEQTREQRNDLSDKLIAKN